MTTNRWPCAGCWDGKAGPVHTKFGLLLPRVTQPWRVTEPCFPGECAGEEVSGWLLILRRWRHKFICLVNHARKIRWVTPGIIFWADQKISIHKMEFWSLLHRMFTFNNEVHEVSGSLGQFSQCMKIPTWELFLCIFFSPLRLYNLTNSDNRSLIPNYVTSS